MTPQPHGRHPVIAVAIAAVLLLTVGGVWLLARDAPSSATGEINDVPGIAVTPAQGCANFARYWLDETSVDIDAAVLEGFTNCRLGADGAWYTLAELPEEQNTNPPSIDPAQEAAANELRARIIADLGTLQQSFTDRMMEELGKVYSDRSNPVIGKTQEGVSVSNVRTRYARIINGMMLDPSHDALTGYVTWMMQTRMDAYGIFRRACLDDGTIFLRQPCTGMEDNLSIRYAPWYWELASEEWLDAYLHHLYGEPDATPAS
ncbi:MAG: hypothetical protein IT335_09450 [Thermomicrobiales bacterium]|nr:hypothetical protein [Thermomicrobiales bacterium]